MTSRCTDDHWAMACFWWTWQYAAPLTCCPTMNLRPWRVGCESIPVPRSSRVIVLPQELEEIASDYKRIAGFDIERLNNRPSLSVVRRQRG